MKLKLSSKQIELFFLVFYFSVSPISKLLQKAGIPREGIYGILLLGMIFYVLVKLNRKNLDAVVVTIALTFPVVMTVFNHADRFNSDVMMYGFLIMFFPGYAIMRVCNKKLLPKALRITAYISIAIYLPNAFLHENIRAVYMSYAYDVLLPVAVILYYASREKKVIDIILSLIGIICLVIFGARGAIVTLTLFYLFITLHEMNFKKICAIMIVVALVIVFVGNIDIIIEKLGSYGISSYTLSRLAKGEFFTSVSRFDAYKYLFDSLDGHWAVYGPLWNREIMPVGYPYPHQLFLEILLDYGLLFGGIFCGGIIIACIHLIRKKDEEDIFIAGIFCIVLLVPLMVSSTFYETATVPFLFALYFDDWFQMNNMRKMVRL